VPISTPPTFNPPKYSIPLGALGTVLTSNGPTAAPTFQVPGAAGISTLGPYLSVAPASGVSNNFNPGGAWPTIGRLDIDTTAGNVELTGLVAGSDGQMVLIRNTGANNLQLDDSNAGSAAANQFASNGNLVIFNKGRTLAVYYAGAINKWSIG
jgi:hypothetical protein